MDNGECLVVDGYGMPVFQSNEQRGRLFVVVNIEMPKSLSALGKSGKEELGKLLALLCDREHVASGEEHMPSAPLHNTMEKGIKNDKRKKNGGFFHDVRHLQVADLHRSDISYFGNYGTDLFDDEAEHASPFAQYFFK